MTTKKKIPLGVRRKVCAAAGAEVGKTVSVPCAACGSIGSIDWKPAYRYWPIISGLEIDHITPEFHGGPTVAANLQFLCRPCNRRKGHRA